MKVTVSKILQSEEKTSKQGRKYTVTTFMDTAGEFYANVYGKFTEGQEVDGEWTTDTNGNKKFEVAKPAGGFGGSRAADPATRASIERQSALKAAVDLVHNYSTTYAADEKVDLKTYVTRVLNVTNALGASLAGQVVQVAPKAEEKPQEEPKPETDHINLDDVPF
jgi:hypothetical protein